MMSSLKLAAYGSQSAIAVIKEGRDRLLRRRRLNPCCEDLWIHHDLQGIGQVALRRQKLLCRRCLRPLGLPG